MFMLSRAIIVFLLILLLVACGEQATPDTEEREELIVLTRNAPTTLYEGRDGTTGPEHDLITAFADSVGLPVRFEVRDNVDEILTAIELGQGDIAAAGLTQTTGRLRDGLVFGPIYQHVEQQVVCRRNNGPIPKNTADLVGKKVIVIDNSSYLETLNALKQTNQQLEWETALQGNTEQLLEMVWKKVIDCTVADSTIVNINRRYYPELVVAFSLDEPQPISWVLSANALDLKKNLVSWFEEFSQSGELAVWQERYYGHVEIFDYVDTRKYIRRIKERLPPYQEYFEVAGKEYDIPWTLLAAQSYQESHWRAKAKSPTGVRGMMMLTLNTAKSLGVKNRLDPKESIFGGAKYFRKMLKRVPETVVGDDRYWYALAAYNVGFGHLRDARQLATRLNKDPNRWVDLKAVLPLLSQKQYYKTLRYGYARGTEPVRYVQRIRDYWQILENNI